MAGFLDGHAQIRGGSQKRSGGVGDAMQEILGLGTSPLRSRRRRRIDGDSNLVRHSARLAVNEFDAQNPDTHWNEKASSPSTPSLLDFREKAYQQVVMEDGSVFWTKEYMGSMFRELRRRTGLTKQFRRSMCDAPLRGGSEGDGKSGMLFFRSHDNRFIVKTLKQSELETFRSIVRRVYYITLFDSLRIRVHTYINHRYESILSTSPKMQTHLFQSFLVSTRSRRHGTKRSKPIIKKS